MKHKVLVFYILKFNIKQCDTEVEDQ